MTGTPCIGCGRVIPAGTGGRCSSCRAPARIYRSSSAHRRIREMAIAAAGGRCVRCGARPPPALELHHDDRLALDLERGIAGDVEILCHGCHVLEHRADRQAWAH